MAPYVPKVDPDRYPALGFCAVFMRIVSLVSERPLISLFGKFSWQVAES